MANTHRVLRQFQGGGMVRNPGDLVDGSEFGGLKALVDQRYLAPIDSDEVVGGMPGQAPDPQLMQEAQARQNRRTGKGDKGGNIAALPETLEGDKGDATEGDGEGNEEGDQPKSLRGKLPEDFPGHAALAAAEPPITTYGQLKKYRRSNDLTGIKGIGDATAAQIEAALGEDTGEENDDDDQE